MEKNILLVDDDDRLRSLISTYLEDKGYKISICKDIEEVDTKQPQQVTNNSLFIGSTSDLQKMLKANGLTDKK